jgi:D-alanyl-D-alanine carboxypeptidase/D-alanyl-D-alanine-endopeptidase (penicillin-binding protein 4)
MALTRRGRIVSATLGVVFVVSGSAVTADVLRVDDPVPDAPDFAVVATPLFSGRRVPELWRQRIADSNMRRRLVAAVPSDGSCAVATVGGDPIGRVDEDAALAPASTMKILTGLGALQVLGADFRYATKLLGPASDESGVIAGDVVLLGGGDPTLATPRYEEYVRANDRFRTDPLTPLQNLVDALVAQGVERIEGDVVGDGSRYSGPTYLASWKPNYRTEGQVGPIGALTVNHGYADFPPPVPVDDPARYAAEQFLTLLDRSGISVGGDAVAGPGGAGGAVIATVESPPLGDIVAGMLTSSDNTTAEMLVREIALARGRPPTTEAGIAEIIATLNARSIRSAGTAALDGSGLSPDSRLTCATLIDAVVLADPVIDAGYADAGQSGTLALRFVGTSFEGVLHAKTGQLNGVVGLAGVLDATTTRPEIRFAFLANGDFDQAGGQALQVAIVEALATYPESPPAGALVTASDVDGSSA